MFRCMRCGADLLADQKNRGINVISLPKTVIAMAAILLAASTATAQDGRAGRYTMHKSDDGFVRLDTQTGAVSLCQKSQTGWGCRDMAGTGSSGSATRLAAENKELRAEVKRLEELLEMRGGSKRSSRPEFKLPTEQEVDQALNYFERMLKKFQDRLKRLENQSGTPERKL